MADLEAVLADVSDNDQDFIKRIIHMVVTLAKIHPKHCFCLGELPDGDGKK